MKISEKATDWFFLAVLIVASILAIWLSACSTNSIPDPAPIQGYLPTNSVCEHRRLIDPRPYNSVGEPR